jgi:hypothetical protein
MIIKSESLVPAKDPIFRLPFIKLTFSIINQFINLTYKLYRVVRVAYVGGTKGE